MTDRYAVYGNPISHSKSPRIHTMFAGQTGQDMRYCATLAPIDGFSQKILADAALNLCGANVTVPFKEEAFRLANRRSERAARAGAVNTLLFRADGEIFGDNTDGAGLVRDLTRNQSLLLQGRRILVLGAGGAVRGVLGPLLAETPAQLCIANRTAEKAIGLAGHFSDLGAVTGGSLEALHGQSFDLVINGTSASLSGELPALPDGIFAPGGAAYDMMYGKDETPFLRFARTQGAEMRIDGLGMLVEQAAEAFMLWRGVLPDSQPVLRQLRAELNAASAS